ncbi:MAG: hypothetical protein H0W30_09205 [Gemmatimonadaceae bacterium]|nr:hypothetical protein [Gemmatimonadaceae bacterium]
MVERRRIGGNGPMLIGLALTVPSLAWLVFTTLSWPERLAWIANIWVCWAVAWAFSGVVLLPRASVNLDRSYGFLFGKPEQVARD